MKLNQFQLMIMKGNKPPKEYVQKYNQIYSFWRELWNKTFTEDFDCKSFLSSNEFTRQDEVVTLFMNDEFVGLFCLRIVDLNELATYHDSYFSKWPEISLHKLKLLGNRVVICSHLTISEKFRRRALGVSWKDVLAALAVRRLMDIDCDVLVGAVRRFKGMDMASYRSGCVPILQNLPYLGDESVDLIAYIKKDCRPCEIPEIANLVDELYSRAKFLFEDEKSNREVKNAA